MSIKLMAHVWETATVGGSELLLLLALADFGNDDGSSIRPSMKTLAKKSRLSIDQARRVIHELIAKNIVELVEMGGWDGKRNRPNEYRILVQGAGTVQGGVLARRKGGTRADASTVPASAQEGVPAPVQDDPSVNPLFDPSSLVVDCDSNNQTDEPLDDDTASDDTALAESLLVEVGVAPSTAKKLAVHGLDLVRRAVATWYTQRREVGGKMENHPGIVVYWLSNLGKAGIPPTLPAAWFDSELGAKYGGDKPEPASRATYAVDLPGVYRLPATVAPSEPAKPLPPRPLATEALPLDGIWLQMLRELFASLPASSDARAWLRDSRLEETGTAPDNAGRVVPLYTVWVTDPKGLDWCNNRAAITLRRMLGSMVGHSVMVVAALQAEPAAEVAVSA